MATDKFSLSIATYNYADTPPNIPISAAWISLQTLHKQRQILILRLISRSLILNPS